MEYVIVLAVIAVAGYFLWKRAGRAADSVDTGTGGGKGPFEPNMPED